MFSNLLLTKTFTYCAPKFSLGKTQLIDVKLDDTSSQVSVPIVTWTWDISFENLLPLIVNVVFKSSQVIGEIELISGVTSIVNRKVPVTLHLAFTPFTYTLTSLVESWSGNVVRVIELYVTFAFFKLLEYVDKPRLTSDRELTKPSPLIERNVPPASEPFLH